ncbi:hypothetical protein BDV93DRAFT_612256 [Ceratobasidium sp. AG-I]|nr:hypothetical protein BDV93DRAFT_612256 [Ceratobasidium sp. AG-I]
MPSWLSTSTLNTSLAWSLGNGGKGRFVVKFPSDLCWYKELLCTRFRSLQHHKERSGLRHEFIVLQFLDGSICRLERMGDPFYRVEALSVRGTTAHDIAQCFRPDQIAEACLDSSDVITDLTLPESLDLLHVLRICRAIQEGDKTCKYTLLGSNCYFFCLAIQACLTRLVDDFEISYPPDNWISVLNTSLDELANTLPSANHPKALLLRLDSMFPGSTSLVDRVVAEIKPKIDASLLQTRVNQMLETELWHSNTGSSVSLAIEKLVQEAIVNALEQDARIHSSCPGLTTSEHNAISYATPMHDYNKALSSLVSLAVSRWERRVGKKRNGFCRNPASDPQVKVLDFRPPSTTSQLAGDSLSKANQLLLAIRDVLVAIIWLLNLALGFFFIRILDIEHIPCALVDDNICAELDQGPSPPDVKHVTEILRKAYSAYEENEAAEWRESPWAFAHALVHRGSSEHIHMPDSKSLAVVVSPKVNGVQSMPISAFQQHLLERVRSHVQSIIWYSRQSRLKLYRELEGKLFQVWLLMRSDDSPVMEHTTKAKSEASINEHAPGTSSPLTHAALESWNKGLEGSSGGDEARWQGQESVPMKQHEQGPAPDRREDEEEQTAGSPDAGTNGQDKQREWCLCRRPDSWGDMIRCDMPTCAIQWYHAVCVGLDASQIQPKDEWICEDCHRKAAQRRKDAHRDGPPLPQEKDRTLIPQTSAKQIPPPAQPHSQAIQQPNLSSRPEIRNQSHPEQDGDVEMYTTDQEDRKLHDADAGSETSDNESVQTGGSGVSRRINVQRVLSESQTPKPTGELRRGGPDARETLPVPRLGPLSMRVPADVFPTYGAQWSEAPEQASPGLGKKGWKGYALVPIPDTDDATLQSGHTAQVVTTPGGTRHTRSGETFAGDGVPTSDGASERQQGVEAD